MTAAARAATKAGHWVPRKQPSQQRAKATVDAILEAAHTIIRAEGYETATTNRIAEVAGVSIGSLYQYFPRKEAIVSAIVEKTVVESGNLIRKRLLESMDLPLEECLQSILGLILETRKANAFIFIRLPREVPGFFQITGRLTTETFLSATIHTFFREHRDQITAEDLDMVMVFCERLVVGSIDAHLEETFPKLSDEDMVKQLTVAVLKYLTT